MSTITVCRQQHATLLGASRCANSKYLFASVKGDGIINYSLQTGEKIAVYALASKKQEVVGLATTNSGLAYVLNDGETKSHYLCFLNEKDVKSSRSLASPTIKIAITKAVHSCYGLKLGKKSSGFLVVFRSGEVGLVTDETQNIQYLPQLLPPASVKGFLASTHGSTFVAAFQTGQNVTLYVYKLKSNQSVTVVVGAPAGALLTHLSLASSCGLLQWSDGHVTIVKEGLDNAQPARNATYLVATPTLAVSSSADETQKRKRKTGDARGAPSEVSGPNNTPSPKFVATLLDDSQFIVLDLESNARQSQIVYTLRDSSFGCPLASGSVFVDVPLVGLALSAASIRVVSSTVEAAGMEPNAAVLLALEDAVLNISLPLSPKPVNLASLVARLRLTQKGSSVDDSGKKLSASSFSLAVQRCEEADEDATAGSDTGDKGKSNSSSIKLIKQARMPTPVAYHFLQLDGSSPAAFKDLKAAKIAFAFSKANLGSDMSLTLKHVVAAAVRPVESSVNSLMAQLSLTTQPPSLELLRVATQSIIDARKSLGFFYQRRQRPSVPGQGTSDSSSSPVVSALQGPSCVALPLRFVDLVLSKCAEAGAWDLVEYILEHTDSGSLTSCSDLLPALVRAGQYRLIPRACRRLDEPLAEDVVTAIREILALVAKGKEQDAAISKTGNNELVGEGKAMQKNSSNNNNNNNNNNGVSADAAEELSRHRAARREYYMTVLKTARALVERSEHLAKALQGVRESQQRAAAAAAASDGVVGTAVVAASGVNGNSPQAHQTAHLEAQARQAMAAAQCAAATVDGWSCTQVLLHALVSLPVDSVALAVAAKSFSRGEADALLSYLARWTTKFSYEISLFAQQSFLSRELLFPRLSQVLEWVHAVTDAHFGSLLLTPPAASSSGSGLREMREAVAHSAAAGEKLLKLRGAVEHVQARASLPYAHIAAATQYSAEVLDLRIYSKHHPFITPVPSNAGAASATPMEVDRQAPSANGN